MEGEETFAKRKNSFGMLAKAFWLVSANHDAGSAPFREPPARRCADFTRGSGFQAMASVANSGYRI
jgi:hypothetical protein